MFLLYLLVFLNCSYNARLPDVLRGKKTAMGQCSQVYQSSALRYADCQTCVLRFRYPSPLCYAGPLSLRHALLATYLGLREK